MIIRKEQAAVDRGTEEDEQTYGARESVHLSDAGGLTEFGAHVQRLQPGSRSSDRHWHEQGDEFLYVISGEATVVEEDGAHLLRPGDAACWPAGVANAHQVVNRSDAPAPTSSSAAGGRCRTSPGTPIEGISCTTTKTGRGDCSAPTGLWSRKEGNPNRGSGKAAGPS